MISTKDTDFQQFSDAAEFHSRRASDITSSEDCPSDACPAVFILERRIDRHRDEINELKLMVAKTTEDTTEILEIVKTGKSFFKVMDWVGTKIMAVAGLIGMIVGIVVWLRPGGKP